MIARARRSLLFAAMLAVPAWLGAQTPVPSAAASEPQTAVMPPQPSAVQPVSRAELEAFVDGIVLSSMDENHIAGAAVAVVQNGEILLKKGYGYRSFSPLRPVDADRTLFRIGSITKTFTWIALMRQVEAGRLGLDDLVNEYLPPALQIPAEGFSKPIRIRDLMTHSPGFEDTALGHLFVQDPARIRPLAQYLQAHRPHRVREPGVLSSYSNYGVALAGAVVEKVAGKPWQDVIETEILLPLGLSHITPREPYPARDGLPAPMPQALANELAGAFRWRGAGFDERRFEYITQTAPAGSMSGSANDMARYMLLLLNDGTLDGVLIFGPRAARAFRTPMTRLPAEVGNWDAGFIDRVLPGGFHAYGHNGATLSNFSDMWVVPDLGLGIFITTNTVGGAKLTSTFADRIVERFYSTRQPLQAGSPGLLKQATRYAGAYAPTRRAYSGLEGFVGALTNVPVTVTPDGYLALPGSRGLQRFAITENPNVFRSIDGSGAIAVQVEKDRVVRILTPGVALERVGFLKRTSTLAAAAGLTLFAAVIIILRLFYSRLAPLPETRIQYYAGLLRAIVSGLWLACMVLFAIWGARAIADAATAVYEWPSPLVVGASYMAIAAALGTAGLILLLPWIWRGTLGLPGWSMWRRARFTYTVVVFAAFAALLAKWGALQA